MKDVLPAATQDGKQLGEYKNPGDYTKRIARAMRQLMQYLDIHSRQLFKNQDITVPQVMCLDELRTKGTMGVAALACAIHLSPSTTVGIIDRLEKKKMVKRTRCNVDRRAVYVEITELGRNFVVATPNLLHNRLAVAMKELSSEEQTVIADVFDRLVQLLKNDSTS